MLINYVFMYFLKVNIDCLDFQWMYKMIRVLKLSSFFPPKTEQDLYAFAIYDIMMTEFSFCVELSL